MPIAFWLYMIGGFSISGFPLFNGFVSKAMTIEAAEFIQRPIIYLLLEGATVGTFLHTGLKLPWNIWLQGREEPPPGIRKKLKDSAINTPVHMLIGMGILAFLCIFLGVYPKILYDMLPYPVEFVPNPCVFNYANVYFLIFRILVFAKTGEGLSNLYPRYGLVCQDSRKIIHTILPGAPCSFWRIPGQTNHENYRYLYCKHTQPEH
jgi:multicomponent Na+:H+ antiporter subunit D